MRHLFRGEDKTVRLGRQYLFKGYGCSGSKKGNRYYKKAISHIKRGAKYGIKYLEYRWRKCDLEYALAYLEKEVEENQKAMELLSNAFACGHDLAVMQYAFFLMEQTNEKFRFCFQKTDEETKSTMAREVFERIQCAYDLDFAPAAYMLAILYRDGYHSLPPDKKKSEFYFSRFEELRVSDQRQAILSTKLPVYDSERKTRKQMNFYAWINWLMK